MIAIIKIKALVKVYLRAIVTGSNSIAVMPPPLQQGYKFAAIAWRYISK